MTRVELAKPSDGDQIKEFYQQFSIKGMVEMRPYRPQSFFAPYMVSSDDFDTYILRGDGDEIQGLASFLYRPVLIGAEIHRIAFATDLRITPSRGPLLEWSQNFLPVIRDVYERKNVMAVFSAISRADPLLHNVFLRPRSPKRAWPRYHLYRRFDMVTLHGRFPWSNGPLKSIRVQRADKNMRDKLVAYLADRANYYPFASVWDEKSFQDRLNRLPGMKVEDFWVALDSSSNILGCVGTWSSRSVQEFRPVTYNLVAHNFRQFLKFGQPLGWTRPLTKPPRSTGVEAPLKFRFLVYPYARNEDVFQTLLCTAYDNIANDEFLVYSHAEQDFRRRPPVGWISASQPHSLYTVIPAELPVPAFLDPSEILNPELETYLYL